MLTVASRTDSNPECPHTGSQAGTMRTWVIAIGCAGLCVGLLNAERGQGAFIGNLNGIKQVGSTVPGNGDVNPYGVAIVPRTIGALEEHDILVSNFNDSSNLQGTGSTIDAISPNGKVRLFARIDAGSVPACKRGVG